MSILRLHSTRPLRAVSNGTRSIWGEKLGCLSTRISPCVFQMKESRSKYYEKCGVTVALSSTTTISSSSKDSEIAEFVVENSEGSFDWKDYWYPIAYEWDIPDGELYSFTLLETPLVIWRDIDGKFRAFKDACPHRLVPLSEGRIASSGCLECPYHGWQFDGSGSCTVIPQGGDHTNPRSAATAYQCTLKQGLVWVKLKPFQSDDAMETDDVPELPELDDPEWFELVPMWRDLPMDYSTLIENVVDVGHVPFTHHASVSKRQSSGTYSDMRVLEKGPWGFTGEWPSGPRRGSLGTQLTLFSAPSLMRHTIDAYDTKGFSNITAVYGVPTTPGRCRLIVRQPFKFKNKIIRGVFGILPDFFGHLGNLDVLDDDNIFLHLQEREIVANNISEKPVGQVFYMPGASDSYVTSFRTWLNKIGGGGPFGPQDKKWLERAGPRLPPHQLLEHYHSHVEKCTICQKALARLKALRIFSGFVGVLGAVSSFTTALSRYVLENKLDVIFSGPKSEIVIVGAAVAAICLGIFSWCSKTLPRFYRGQRVPQRNKVPGEWSP